MSVINRSENTSRIAKNTLYLYGRMFFSMAVSLYTSRAILNALGVEDYGINNLVGGFLGTLSFLNASMSGATARFITYALGKGDKDELKKTFSTAVIIHGALALLIVVLAETIGLWMLETKLVIPTDRMNAARYVYQIAVIGTFLGIMQTPYGALMVSHEKIKLFAGYDILSVCLRLLIVYLLLIIPGDNLITWGTLTFCVSLLMMALYRITCLKHFTESHFKWVIDKKLLKPMLSFSGWDLFGNMAVMMRTQGVTVVLNLFFGPLLNAASGIAGQIQGAVMSFSNNIITAYRPQLVKQYAQQEYGYMFELMRDALRLSTLLLLLITIPIMVELNFIIELWLGQVPEYVVPISRFTLVFNMFASIGIILAAIVHATGKMKRISLINGSIYIMVIPITFLVFKYWSQQNPVLPFILNVLGISLGILQNAYSIKLYIPSFKLKQFIFQDYFMCVLLFLCTYFIVFYTADFFEEGWTRLIISIILSTAILISAAMTFFLPEEIKSKALKTVKHNLSLIR